MGRASRGRTGEQSFRRGRRLVRQAGSLLLVGACLVAAACSSAAPSTTSAPAASAAPSSPAAAASPGAGSPVTSGSGASVSTTGGERVGSTLDEVIALAQQEGTVNWAVAPDFNEGVTRVHDLVKQLYGVDLQINANAEQNYTAKAAKAVTEVQAGALASYDLLDVSDSTVPPLVNNNAALQVPWGAYIQNMPPEAVTSNTMLVVQTSFLSPDYNPNIIPADQAPKTYEDLLDPKWKGKVSVINAMSAWVWLAQPNAWGEQKLYDYMQQLAAQDPVLDRYDGMLSRLLSGEYPISSGIDSAIVNTARKQGKPVQALDGSLVRASSYGGVVPVNAVHPNAAILIEVAMVTPQGQQIRDDVNSATAAWVSNTSAQQFEAQHQTIELDVPFTIQNQDRIVARLDQIMGAQG